MSRAGLPPLLDSLDWKIYKPGRVNATMDQSWQSVSPERDLAVSLTLDRIAHVSRFSLVKVFHCSEMIHDCLHRHYLSLLLCFSQVKYASFIFSDPIMEECSFRSFEIMFRFNLFYLKLFASQMKKILYLLQLTVVINKRNRGFKVFH